MKIIAFYLKQILLLGTTGFAAFVAVAWWHIGVFWASDTPQAWLLALFLVTLFLVLIATPLVLLSRLTHSKALPYIAGFASGPIGVWTALLTYSHYPIGLEWYVSRVLFFHVVFASIGLLFAFSFQRWAGPNNSFKPKPLRGSA
jgi:hypothetical protein